MSTPPQKSLSIWQGNDERFIFNLKDASGLPMDLTDSEIVLTVASIPDLRKSTNDVDSGLELTDAAAGQFMLTITHGETRNMPKGNNSYEIERRLDGWQTTLLYGYFEVQGGLNDDV